MLRKGKILGRRMDLDIENVHKLASDLSVLQADVFRQTRIEHYLDHDASEGHTNFELNKFGVALQRAIKADLREHPKKRYLEFYITLMTVLYDMRNYELAARVHAAINDALMRDHCEPKPGEFEFPPEDKKIKRVRDALSIQLDTLPCAAQFHGMRFPIGEKARTLYHGHIEQNQSFVPMIEILFKFISMILEGDQLSASDVKHRETNEEKLARLMMVTRNVGAELNSIIRIIKQLLPKDQARLHFDWLRKKFKHELSLNLDLQPSSVRDQLRKILKVDAVIADMNPELGKQMAQLSYTKPVLSPRGKIKPIRHVSPRKKITDGDSFESPRTEGAVSPRAVSPRSPRSDESCTEDLYSPRSLEAVSPRSPRLAAVSPRTPRDGFFGARSPRVKCSAVRESVAQLEVESSSSSEKNSLRNGKDSPR